MEILAAGPPDAISRLREALTTGPPGASVTRVEESAASIDHARDFRIDP